MIQNQHTPAILTVVEEGRYYKYSTWGILVLVCGLWLGDAAGAAARVSAW
jgi:hypothetical protein